MPDDATLRWLEEFPDRLRREIAAAEEETRQDLLRTADLYSSGPLSLADLRRLDHPYARRHGSPRRTPGIINEQSGKFRRAWKSEGPVLDEDGTVTALWNESDVGPYLEQRDPPPTKTTMFERPVADLIAADVEPRRLERLDAAIDRATR